MGVSMGTSFAMPRQEREEFLLSLERVDTHL